MDHLEIPLTIEEMTDSKSHDSPILQEKKEGEGKIGEKEVSKKRVSPNSTFLLAKRRLRNRRRNTYSAPFRHSTHGASSLSEPLPTRKLFDSNSINFVSNLVIDEVDSRYQGKKPWFPKYLKPRRNRAASMVALHILDERYTKPRPPPLKRIASYSEEDSANSAKTPMAPSVQTPIKDRVRTPVGRT